VRTQIDYEGTLTVSAATVCWSGYFVHWEKTAANHAKVDLRLDSAHDGRDAMWIYHDALSLVSKADQLALDGPPTFKAWEDMLYVVVSDMLVGVWTIKGQQLLAEAVPLCANGDLVLDFFPFERGLVVHTEHRIHFFEFQRQYFTHSAADKARLTSTTTTIASTERTEEEQAATPTRKITFEEASLDMFDDDALDLDDNPAPHKKPRIET